MGFHWVLPLLPAINSIFAGPPGPSTALVEPFDHHPVNSTTSKLPLIGRNFTSDTCEPEPTSRYLNSATEKFAVNGTGIPEVDFDVGESYAGLLPISNKTDEKDNMFFWFFPTVNEEHKDDKEIVIWLSGGPGCSSLIALLQENGPFSWQPGTLKPKRNPWSWHLLTNVVWIEQPIGTGFSAGEPSITNEDELAAQFMGFWRNFVDVFGLHGWRIYIAAESYGGYYGPYISSHFIDANDTDYYNLTGLIIYDGAITAKTVHYNLPILPYISRHASEFALDNNTLSLARHISDECGFTEFYDRYLTFPPSGMQPTIDPVTHMLPNVTSITNVTCIGMLRDTVLKGAIMTNACFNDYNILDHCPMVYTPIDSNDPYFDRTDVKKAIHAPASTPWQPCTGPEYVFKTADSSLPSGLKQLPQVIEITQNVIIAHGDADWAITMDGVLLGIQNMTWSGKMGFQCKPKDPFYVPLYGFDPFSDQLVYYASDMPAGTGVMGTVHEERGFTFVVTKLAGHQGPGYAPAASLRHLEKLLGRVDSMSCTEPFTLPELRNITQLEEPLGMGTVHIPEGRGSTRPLEG
ncbi:Alpha/Beta hydrolase protein [Trichoderma compactum]